MVEGDHAFLGYVESIFHNLPDVIRKSIEFNALEFWSSCDGDEIITINEL